MIFLFDTNIIYNYLKRTSVMQKIEETYNPFQEENECWLSVVSLGEIRSMALCNQWGSQRMKWIEGFLQNFLVVDLGSEEVISRYAEVEAFSQCRLSNFSPLPISPRNMGKNDLWIAATASVLSATLLTTDKDFDHLDKVFLELAKIQVKS